MKRPLLRFGSIRLRLLISFIVVALVPMAITGAYSSIVSTKDTQKRLANQLESIATLKEAEIDTWINTLSATLSNLLAQPDAKNMALSLLQSEGTSSADYKSIHDALLEQFSLALEQAQGFDEIFLLDAKGRVVLSTDPIQEGKSFAAQPFFQEGIKKSFVEAPTYFPFLGKYRVVSVQPFLDGSGKAVGVLAGRARTDQLDAIMLERAGLGQTGETYLVGLNKALVTALRAGDKFLEVNTFGAEQALEKGLSGSGQYQNALGEEVIGVYHWLPELQVALLAEQNRSEAYGSLISTLAINGGVILASMLLAVLMASLISRSIANPITELANTTAQIASGNLELSLESQRNDEIGALAQAFNRMAAQLRDLVSDLEQRVIERTQEVQRRSAQIQAAAEIARDVNSTTDLNELLNQAVTMVRDRFGFYHAGLFLLDERREYAVLKAATGEAGKRMLQQGHKLRVGAVGIVGDTTSNGKPHIALDVGQDITHFKNPLLPLTHSEMALPLRVGERLIGALDVQSTKVAAFEQDDINILQTMADQLAIAIENARLIQQLSQTVQELEQAYGRYTQDAWRILRRDTSGMLGFRFQQVAVEAVSDQRPEARQALEEGKTVSLPAEQLGGQGVENPYSVLAVPIKLRNQTIGVLNLRFQGPAIPEETVSLIEDAAGRLALVLENARLLADAQRTAVREQQINLITSQMRSSVNMETILQNTVRELGRALGASRTFIQIGGEQNHAHPIPGANGHPAQ